MLKCKLACSSFSIGTFVTPSFIAVYHCIFLHMIAFRRWNSHLWTNKWFRRADFASFHLNQRCDRPNLVKLVQHWHCQCILIATLSNSHQQRWTARVNDMVRACLGDDKRHGIELGSHWDTHFVYTLEVCYSVAAQCADVPNMGHECMQQSNDHLPDNKCDLRNNKRKKKKTIKKGEWER